MKRREFIGAAGGAIVIGGATYYGISDRQPVEWLIRS